MNNIDHDKLLALRLRDRDRQLQIGMNRALEDAAAHGSLRGSQSFRALHLLMEAELSASSGVIIDSLMEGFSASTRLPVFEEIQAKVEGSLQNRRRQLEAHLDNFANRHAVQNRRMAENFLTLDHRYPLVLEEARTNVLNRIEDLKNQRGKTRLQRWIFWLENNPIWAGVGLIVILIGSVKGLIDFVVWLVLLAK